jgi:hypothetical protein
LLHHKRQKKSYEWDKQQREDKKLYIFSHISVGICNTSKRE